MEGITAHFYRVDGGKIKVNTNKIKFMGHNLRLRENDKTNLPMSDDAESVERLGKLLLESQLKLAKNESWLTNSQEEKTNEFFEMALGIKELPSSEEFDNMSKEDLTFPNNTALYTTVVRNIVERAFESNKLNYEHQKVVQEFKELFTGTCFFKFTLSDY